jgi:hypothetical protein
MDSDNGAYGDNCPARDVFLSASALGSAAAKGAWDTATVRLSASSADESHWNQWSWKRFQATGASGVVLYFYWRNAPDVPAPYGTQDTFDWATGQTGAYHCSTTKDITSATSRPDFVGVNNPNVFQAQVKDSKDDNTIGSQNDFLNAVFALKNETTGDNLGPLTAGGAAGETSGSVFTYSRAGSGGDEYSYTVRGATVPTTDGNQGKSGGASVPAQYGPSTSPPCYFVVDDGHPAAPQIGTNWTPSSYVGTAGTFTFSEPAGYTTSYTAGPLTGKNDVVGYLYGIDSSQPSMYVPTSSMGGSASITIRPYTPSEIDLYVQAVGAGGNPSNSGGSLGNGVQKYKIISTAAPGNIAALGWWRLNNNGSEDPAVGDASENLTTLSGAGYGCGSAASPPGFTCSLDLAQSAGTSEHVATRPVAGADGSFSVSAWVNPAGCLQAYCAVLSQGAVNVSEFTLGYQASGYAEWKAANGVVTSTKCPCWLASVPQADVAGDEYAPNTAGTGYYLAAAQARTGEQLNTWTQLTAVMDASSGQLRLYVNGGDGQQHPGDSQPGDGTPAAAASASRWSSSPNTGYFRIGADWTALNGLADFFDGSVSDVCVFYGVLNTVNNPALNMHTDVQDLYASGSGDGCAAVTGRYP